MASNILVAYSFLHQGVIDDKWSTHAFKRGMVTVNDTTGEEVLYMNSVNKMKLESIVMINNELCL